MRRAILTALLAICWCLRPLAGAEEAGLDFVEKVLGGETREPLPLVIALHGLGDSPERFSALFSSLDAHVRLVAPRAPDPYSVGTSWFPIDDRARAPASIRARAKQLVALAVELKRTRKVRGLPIVTGFSQGGYMSFALAAYHSEHFAAALPIAGALPAALPAPRKARPGFRVVAFHGEADRRVPFSEGERATARLRKSGLNASLKSYRGLGHSVSPELADDYLAALRAEIARLE